jgi:hypothetical protein
LDTSPSNKMQAMLIKYLYYEIFYHQKFALCLNFFTNFSGRIGVTCHPHLTSLLLFFYIKFIDAV